MVERKTVLLRIALVLVLAAGTYLVMQPLTSSTDFGERHLVRQYLLDASDNTEETSLLFTGDVMLGRDIEVIMNTYGERYPFRVLDNLPPYRAVIGNFEAAIPEVHVPTIPPSTILSASSSVASTLATVGFTHVSLANNHSFDFDAAGFRNTQSTLRSVLIDTFGHPTLVGSTTVTYEAVNGVTVAVLGLHTLFTEPSFEALDALMMEVNQHSDLQIAYVHWGEEYQSTHSRSQEQFADTLVQLGIDVIIGHHPHVVQDIGYIRGVPVFYSLGNFIFDQYFSDEVQEGLLLTLEVTDEPRMLIMPVTSLVSRGQPQLMAAYERDRYLRDLASRSDPRLSQWIETGIVPLSLNLASSQENVIMAQ